MRDILPLVVTRQKGILPAANGNPVLNFITLQDEAKSPLVIQPDDAKNFAAYFDFFQFGKLAEGEYEVCYSSSADAHGRLVIDYAHGKAYHFKLPPGTRLDAKTPKAEARLIRHSGLLPSGCYAASASQPRVVSLRGNTLTFSSGKNPLCLNEELLSLVTVEMVGSGALFSLKEPGAVFRYRHGVFQHFYISLTYPKEVGGRTYYGGQNTTFHNTGATIDSNVVDMHQALLRQVLFGTKNKPLTEELDILAGADVFLGYKEICEYHAGARQWLDQRPDVPDEDPPGRYSRFKRAADILMNFAGKLEDPDETNFLKSQCLFGKMQAEMALAEAGEGDAGGKLEELQKTLLEHAQLIGDGAKRKELHEYFAGCGWQISFEQLFADSSQS